MGTFALSATAAANTPRPITLFLAGDVLLGRGVTPALRAKSTNLQFWGARIQGANIAFCNLECAVSDKPPHRSFRVKLTTPPSNLKYLQEAGFDVVSTANNHALDNGSLGVRRLEEISRACHFATVGSSYQSLQQWPSWSRQVVGQRITWLAATNWGPFRSGAAQVRPIADSELIEQVKTLARQGDRVFVSLHWGQEYVTKPTTGQRQLAHDLIDAGAICIVGHHSHCAGPAETYRGRPIFYSLGNFVFDRTPLPQSGLVVILRLQSEKVTFQTTRVNPLPLTGKALKVHPSTNLPMPHSEIWRGELVGHFLPAKAPQRLLWSQSAKGFHWLRLFQQSGGKWRLVAQGSHPIIEAMRRGDVDGDGSDEIWLQLKQRSKLDTTVRSRLHLYRADAKRGFLPLWRGSTLSRDFHDWALLPGNRRGTDLAALETNNTPELRDFSWLSIYRWNGFGFRRLWDAPLRGQLRDLNAGKDKGGPFLRFKQRWNSKIRSLELRPDAKNSPELFRAVVKQDWQ